MIRRWQDRQRAQLRQALNHPAASTWENLGLWSRPDQPYAEAAHALAMRVGTAAALQPGERVLDIGPGQGQDQPQLWTREFAIGHYYGWERDMPTPPPTPWQHVLAVDSAYFIPNLWQRWQSVWPHVTTGGTITWTNLYLVHPLASWRSTLRLRLTSALSSIPWQHWRTRDDWLQCLSQLPAGAERFDDLTDAVLGGFVRHMRWRSQSAQPRAGLRIAYGTAALLEPLLAEGVIGYGLFQVRRQ